MDFISSSQNPKFKMLKSLATSKGIKKERACLVSGKFIVPEIQKAGLDYKLIHYSEDLNPDLILEKKLFKELSPIKSEEPMLLVKTPELKPVDLESSPKGLEVLLPVGDPKNLGALIRTCKAFEVDRIILLKEAAHPFLPDSIKASSGLVFSSKLFTGPSLQELSTKNAITSLDVNGTNLKDWTPSQNLRLLLGEEGGHIPKELLKKSLKIPISPDVESLNVNSALSILLYDFRSKV